MKDKLAQFLVRFIVGINALLVIVLLTLIFSSCATQQPQVVEKIVTNTEYVDRWRVDSIYIDKVQYIDRASDTIRIVETNTEYRYKVLTDTLRIQQVDSIPYEVQVIEIVERMNDHQRTMYWLGWLAVVIVALRLFWKIYRIFKR